MSLAAAEYERCTGTLLYKRPYEGFCCGFRIFSYLLELVDCKYARLFRCLHVFEGFPYRLVGMFYVAYAYVERRLPGDRVYSESHPQRFEEGKESFVPCLFRSDSLYYAVRQGFCEFAKVPGRVDVDVDCRISVLYLRLGEGVMDKSALA